MCYIFYERFCKADFMLQYFSKQADNHDSYIRHLDGRNNCLTLRNFFSNTNGKHLYNQNWMVLSNKSELSFRIAVPMFHEEQWLV